MGKIRFNTNYQKCIESISFLLNTYGSINIYNLMKILFSADKYHLNTYARPVTGDSYIRMPNGTVPSSIRDIINNNPVRMSEIGSVKIPFSVDNENHMLISKKITSNFPTLSETDIEALNFGFSEYGKLSYSEVYNKNHNEEISWQKTPPNKKIPFELMIENDDIRNDLIETSHLIVI